MNPIMKVLVCDDHPLFRAGVISCFAERADIKVVGEATDGDACIAKLELFTPDILIADLSMPQKDGFQVLEWLAKHQPQTRAFILSMHSDLAYVQKARDLGASGFLAKEDAQAELLAAIAKNDGQFYTSSSIGRSSPAIELSSTGKKVRDGLRDVSEAEMRVLTLLTENITSRAIAEKLNLSVRTVQAHRVSLADKLGARGPNKLLELALKNAQMIRHFVR
ncbi:MAG: response regulator transcription factor [Pseudomonadota bacterium]